MASSSLASRRAVLLDLDGTLIDSSRDIASALNHVMASEGLAPFAVEDVQRMIGDGAAVLVHRAFAARGAAEPADGLARFKARYDAHCLDETRPYPGMAALVERLVAQGRRVGVVTNKPTGFSEKIVDALGLRRWVTAVVGPELASALKPAPEHVLATLALLGSSPDESVVVGDGTTDVLSGRAAGCATVAVLWGYRSREELATCAPDHFVATVDELAALLGA